MQLLNLETGQPVGDIAVEGGSVADKRLIKTILVHPYFSSISLAFTAASERTFDRRADIFRPR